MNRSGIVFPLSTSRWGTSGRLRPRADWATNDSAVTETRARSSRACSSLMSSSCLMPHAGASMASALCTSTRTSPEWIVEGIALGRGQARRKRVVDQEAPHVAERDVPGQLLDIHPAVTERAAILVRLGDLGLEGDNAFQSWLVVGHRVSFVVRDGAPVVRGRAVCVRAPFTVTVLPWPPSGCSLTRAQERTARTPGRAIPRFSYSISPDLPNGSRRNVRIVTHGNDPAR